LANISDSIEELYCDNNQLSQIDLSNTKIIKLKCYNNCLVEIKNIPNTIEYFDYSLNPLEKIPIIENIGCKIRC